MFYALAGSWEAVWEGASYPVTLPGTLDENNIGYADSGEDQRLPPGERKGGGAPLPGASPASTPTRAPSPSAAWWIGSRPRAAGCSSRWAVPATCVCW